MDIRPKSGKYTSYLDRKIFKIRDINISMWYEQNCDTYLITFYSTHFSQKVRGWNKDILSYDTRKTIKETVNYFELCEAVYHTDLVQAMKRLEYENSVFYRNDI
jgi:hypothetical protein